MKLKAFTIMELLVVSILSAICAGAVFSGFQVIQQQFLGYERDTKAILEMGAFQVQLEKDFAESVWVYREADGIRMELENYVVFYGLEEEGKKINRQIIVDGYNKETLPFLVRKANCYFEKEEIDAGSVDYIELQLEVDTRLFTFSLKKEYSARQKMQIKRFN